MDFERSYFMLHSGQGSCHIWSQGLWGTTGVLGGDVNTSMWYLQVIWDPLPTRWIIFSAEQRGAGQLLEGRLGCFLAGRCTAKAQHGFYFNALACTSCSHNTYAMMFRGGLWHLSLWPEGHWYEYCPWDSHMSTGPFNKPHKPPKCFRSPG